MALSPMMSHYLQTKEKYKDCILFYRLGDFYEMFFDDAIKASELLELTLTGRDCGLEKRAPMCGIPFHAADAYIAKLVALGEKVAICEQLTDPAEAKGLVDRDVIKIITAGTVSETSLLNETSNNFLAAVYKNNGVYAISWCDITTGETFVSVFKGEDALSKLVDALVRINPAEVICNEEMYFVSAEMPIVKHGVIPKFAIHSECAFGYSYAEKTIKKQFCVANLASFNLTDETEAVCVLGALIDYIIETQKHALLNITDVKFERGGEYMMLDSNSLKNLEIVKSMRDGKKYGSLLWLLDKTKTAMGARNLLSWLTNPLNNIDKINYRLDGVEELYKNTLIRNGITDLLRSVKDIGRIVGKLSNDNITPRDFKSLEYSLDVIPSLKFQLFGFKSKILLDVDSYITDFSELVVLLKRAIVENPPVQYKEGNFINDGYSDELDALRDVNRNGKNIIAKIEQAEREKTGIKTLKIGYNRVFGYYIEVTNSFKDKVHYDYIRKQTLANAERYITEELKATEEKILGSEGQIVKLEAQLFIELKHKVSDFVKPLMETSHSIAVLDTLLAFASVSKNNRYCRPQLLPYDGKLNITDGRHPVIEAIIDDQFIPNDALLDNEENRMVILTGPNMAGKSTYLRQIALIVFMAHIGCFVPARTAEIPLTDKIFTRVGASDNLIFDQSTFMVEMSEVSYILRNATRNSLLILDEVGRGTSTYDGLSIAWSVVEYISKTIMAKTLFATHYHELTELEGALDGVKNYKITLKELNGQIVFLRKIMRGGANRSFGIEVASLAGVPKDVTKRASSILNELEKKDTAAKNRENVGYSQVEKIISELKVEELTPMQAFNILCDLKEKVN